jgi:hypothetical protein
MSYASEIKVDTPAVQNRPEIQVDVVLANHIRTYLLTPTPSRLSLRHDGRNEQA